MSKSAPISQNTTQQTLIPNWLQGASADVTRAQGNLPQYTDPYAGNPYAGLSPDQLQALQAASSAYGTPGGIVGQATPYANALAGFQAPQVGTGGVIGNTQAYMNPYIQNVINASNRQMDLNTGQAMSNLDTNFAQQGAFGGSRQGVADANLQSQADIAKSNMASNLYSGGYNNALATSLQQALANQQAGIQGGQIQLGGTNALANLAQILSGTNAQGLAGLLQAGGVQQQTGTNQGLFNYQNWLNQFQIPENILQARAGVLGSLPHSQTQTGQTTGTAYSNPLASALGLTSLLGSNAGTSALSGLTSLGSVGLNALSGLGSVFL